MRPTEKGDERNTNGSAEPKPVYIANFFQNPVEINSPKSQPQHPDPEYQQEDVFQNGEQLFFQNEGLPDF